MASRSRSETHRPAPQMSSVPEQEPQDPDTIVLRSAGIDIGSATTHLVTSRITMKRLGRSHSSRYVIVDRQLEYMSPIALTPYIDRELIDADRLMAQLREWIASDGYDEDAIDTGVVMLTGEAARRKNARQITDRVSLLAGDFVCAAAGDLFEVDMAAHGSGAVALSEDGRTTLNIDIGGGTTKISVCKDGEIVNRGVFRVGARDVVVDDSGLINRLESPGDLAAAALGINVGIGEEISDHDRERIARWLVERLDEFLRSEPTSEPIEELTIVPMEPLPEIIDLLVFSSGVGEYIYERESRSFGDLAVWIADSVREKCRGEVWPWPVHVPEGSPIRATVTGIAEQTVEMSGDTIYVGTDSILPLRNLEVRALDISGMDNAADISQAMKDAVARDNLTSGTGEVIWEVRCAPNREYRYLAELARGLGEGGTLLSGGPLALILDQDIAMLVGRLMADELEITKDVVVLDGISLKEVHFVDLGRFRPDSNTVPVVLKSLVFVDRSSDD